MPLRKPPILMKKTFRGVCPGIKSSVFEKVLPFFLAHIVPSRGFSNWYFSAILQYWFPSRTHIHDFKRRLYLSIFLINLSVSHKWKKSAVVHNVKWIKWKDFSAVRHYLEAISEINNCLTACQQKRRRPAYYDRSLRLNICGRIAALRICVNNMLQLIECPQVVSWLMQGVLTKQPPMNQPRLAANLL